MSRDVVSYALDVGRKFSSSESPLPFADNTYLGHLKQQGQGFKTFNTILKYTGFFRRADFSGKWQLSHPVVTTLLFLLV